MKQKPIVLAISLACLAAPSWAQDTVLQFGLTSTAANANTTASQSQDAAAGLSELYTDNFNQDNLNANAINAGFGLVDADSNLDVADQNVNQNGLFSGNAFDASSVDQVQTTNQNANTTDAFLSLTLPPTDESSTVNQSGALVNANDVDGDVDIEDLNAIGGNGNISNYNGDATTEGTNGVANAGYVSGSTLVGRDLFGGPALTGEGILGNLTDSIYGDNGAYFKEVAIGINGNADGANLSNSQTTVLTGGSTNLNAFGVNPFGQ
jgi:hypothetical protein